MKLNPKLHSKRAVVVGLTVAGVVVGSATAVYKRAKSQNHLHSLQKRLLKELYVSNPSSSVIEMSNRYTELRNAIDRDALDIETAEKTANQLLSALRNVHSKNPNEMKLARVLALQLIYAMRENAIPPTTAQP